jgi:hypothetical protein
LEGISFFYPFFGSNWPMDDRGRVEGVAVATELSPQEFSKTASGSLLFAGYRISLRLSTKRPSSQPQKGFWDVSRTDLQPAPRSEHPVDRAKLQRFDRTTEWAVFNPEGHKWLFSQPAS